MIAVVSLNNVINQAAETIELDQIAKVVRQHNVEVACVMNTHVVQAEPVAAGVLNLHLRPEEVFTVLVGEFHGVARVVEETSL